VAQCILELAASRKTRVTSHLYHAYGMRENHEMAREQGLDVHAVDLSTAPLADANCFQCLQQDKQVQDAVVERFLAASFHLGPWRTQIRDAYMYLSEKRPVVAFALALLHYKVKVEPLLGRTIEPICQARLESLENHDFEMVISDDAVDMHTAHGRGLGKTVADFRSNGARLANEDPAFHDAALVYVYINGK